MTALTWIALLCAAGPALLFLRNLSVFSLPARGHSAAVSILIPARNEEPNIASAVRAALANEGAEVLVLDDNSTDGTPRILEEIAAGEPRLRVLQGEPLPAGWIGKNFACAQLATAASKSWLLFIDADVRLAPDAAARLAAAMHDSGAKLISGVPRQETRTLSEQLLVPLIPFLLLGFLPLRRMRASLLPAYGTACGQLIMADAAAYRASGGHAAIRDRIHDGLALPKQFRAVNFSTDLVDVTEVATCHMYRRDRDVWSGFSKNTHEGLGAPARIVPVTLLLLAGQVLPFALALTGSRLAITAVALALLPRIAGLRRFHQPLLGAILHPFAIIALLAIQWTGLFRWMCGSSAHWKGRAYLPAKA